MKKLSWLGMAFLSVLLLPEWALAQPSRNMPGTRPYLPGTPPINPAALNPRTRSASDAVGVESTDFYGKKGYPRVLGDSVESQTTGGSAGGVSASGGSLAGGLSGSGGLSGATGAGGAGGGLSGGLSGATGGGITGFANGRTTNPGFTGGGFSGLGPKGFGFGGVPVFEASSLRYLSK